MIREHAVSEVIGSILLISLVGIAVAIVAIMFLSHPVPVETQSLNVIAGNNSTHLFLYHDGGDAMVRGEYKIRLLPSGDEPDITTEMWYIGTTLNLPVNPIPERIQIISTRQGQETLIKEITIGTVVTPGPITPRPPQPDPGPCDDCVANFTERLGNGSVYFSRDVRGPTGQTGITGFINLTINGTGSYIVNVKKVQGEDVLEEYKLTPGALLSIRFDSGNNVRIFAIGDRGWSISGFTNVRNNGTLVTGDLKDIWITSYTNLHSTLTFSAGAGGNNEFVRLIINGTKTDEMSDDIYHFVNIRPSEPTLFILNYPSGQERPVFFIGQADKVLRESREIYPIP
ncbi:MAG TPA: type IV pilin [Methanoregulaceae archaeon]|jgi:hypothetical protein|nr:type IV pilin [Methanoregulaceae archaeon]